ncbi:MAG: hypothetical protein JWR21_3687 [Herminiimonas sp.]|nr:hypothetical protein [Herminiimonas sp.]
MVALAVPTRDDVEPRQIKALEDDQKTAPGMRSSTRRDHGQIRASINMPQTR